MRPRFGVWTAVGVALGVAVILFFALGGVGRNPSGYLIGLGVFVIPAITWMLSQMWRYGTSVPTPREPRR